MRVTEREFDVIVAGGGISGTMAAIAAAREGADTLLVERYSALGGMATLGLVQPITTWGIGGRFVIAGTGRLQQTVVGAPVEVRAGLQQMHQVHDARHAAGLMAVRAADDHELHGALARILHNVQRIAQRRGAELLRSPPRRPGGAGSREPRRGRPARSRER